MESDFFDPPILVGNDDLKPEMITTYDAQLFYRDKKTYAAVTYFNGKIEKLIIYDTGVSPMSYKNGGEQKFDGVEFETKRFLTPHWHVLGSFTYQNSDQSSDINPSVVPDYMLKFGTAYTWDWGSAALFYTYFSKPPRLATEVVVNPEPDAINLLSLNVRMDASRWLDVPKGKTVLTLRGENLFNEDIYVPDFQRDGNPNSLPESAGATFYAGLMMKF